MKKLTISWQFFVLAFALLTCFEVKGQHDDCFLKNDFTYEFVNCSTIVVSGNPVANSHHWNFGNGWFNGNAQETYSFPSNCTYTIQHSVESGEIICEKTVVVNCGGFTIEENEDPCYKDFACFRFVTNACPSAQLTWDFGDGTVVSCTDCATVEHCYTNVNTINGTNTQVSPTLTYNGQTTSNTLNIAAYDAGIFIGNPGAVSDLSQFSVLPGSSHNGNTQGNPVYVYGTIRINKTFTLSSTDIFVERSGGFNVNPSRTFTLQNGTAISSAINCPCLWRGIDVYGGGTLNALQSTSLGEALYAVRPYKITGANPTIGLRGVTFWDNYIGLMAAPPLGSLGNGNFIFDATTGSGFKGNTFTSVQVKQWCGDGDNVPDPFGPSGAFSPDRGWAGVYLNSVNNFQVPATTNAVNAFSDLANGIYMVNSSAVGTSNLSGIWNCTFTNMLRGGYSTALGGHGIYFVDGQGGNAISQEGFGMNNTASFSNCEVGIFARSDAGSAVLNSHDNLMQGMEFGYFVTGVTGEISSEIIENEIHSDAEYGHNPGRSAGVWIEDRFSQPKQHIIDENIIVVDQPTEVFSFGVFIVGSFDVNATVNNVSVGNNTGNGIVPGITVVNGTSCVQVIQYGGVNVHNNAMLAQQGTAAGLRGIFFFGGQNNIAQCNLVEGPTATGLLANIVGVDCGGSLNAILRDNDIESFERGIAFSNNSGNASLSCNDLLGTQDIGLFYDASAVTGFQFDRGNQWLGTYNLGALHVTPSLTINGNQFRARQSTTEWPPTLDPIFGWFNNSNIIPQCPFDPECQTPPGEMLMETPTELDNLIAGGGTGGEAGLLWDMEKYLYSRLMANPVAWQGNSLMQGFVSANENTTLGQFYEIGEGIKALYQIDGITQAQLDANRDDIETKRTAIEVIDTTLPNTPQGSQYDSLLQQRQQLLDEVSILYQANGTIYAALHDARVLRADSLLAANDAVVATEPYEINEKSFFEVYLNTVGKDSKAATTNQIAALEDIASQCPAEGGRAIYWAIGLHGHLTGELLEVQDCGQIGPRSRQDLQTVKAPEKGSFSLFPNPGAGPCTIVCQMPENTTGEVVVIDIFGRKQGVYPVANGNDSVTLTPMPAGTYQVSLVSQGNIIQAQTLIIQ